MTGSEGALLNIYTFQGLVFAILIGNNLVNKYGLDTLETGSMIAWAMELYEMSILTDTDTDGLKLEWGNDEAVLELIRQIAFRSGSSRSQNVVRRG